ncbi:hypothetical protein MtrunA17_Chr1g0154931 [Medicago truncatula]|uniref:Uncharacterized protein n=1 Tax=Medicago truncatula TaxID=3880 RepID=A0A396JMA4_MEDTR|nr:hypothetical protein MtrunA17_Chr1g0154931 [Medicago truncatula]
MHFDCSISTTLGHNLCHTMKTYANVPPRETPKMRLTHLHSKSVVYWPFHIHVSQYILLLSM